MWYIDIVILKDEFDDIYRNNATVTVFSIQDNIIHVEENDWSICATFILSVWPLRSSANLLKSYSNIIIFQARERFVIPSSSIV